MSRWPDPAATGVDAVVSLLLDSSIKGALVLGAAALAALALRRGPASSRHLAWSLGIAGMLVLPPLSAALPAWSLRIPAVARPRPHPSTRADAPAPRGVSRAEPLPLAGPFALAAVAGEAVPRAPAAVGLTPGPEAPPPLPAKARAYSVASLLLGAWLAGAALAALPLALGLWSLWRIGRRSSPARYGSTHRLLARLAGEIGLNRPVRLVRNRCRTMPMTWGAWSPVILLPADAESWPPERLSMVLLHELAHIKRHDFLTQCLARLACAVYWFNPLAWLAAARLRVEQERASDDLALARGIEPADYAAHLLAIVAGEPSRPFGPAVAPAVASSHAIERRLLAILDPGRNRRPLSRRRLGLTALVAAGLLVPLAAGRIDSASAAPPEPGNKVALAAAPQDDALEAVKRNYIKPPEESALLQGALKGMVEALHDPYSEYLSPQSVAELERQTRGSLTGIGAQLAAKDGKVTVITPLPNSPAHKAGVLPDDEIVSIDGQPVKDVELTEVVKRIVGPAGSVVRLGVVHKDGNKADLAIERGRVAIATVRGFRLARDGRWEFMLDDEHKVGYVHVDQFGSATPEELRSAVRALQARGMKGLILDLRSSPGGLLESAVQAVRAFVSEGTIVTTRGRDGHEQSWKAEAKEALGDFPLVVLVNEQTASAAEIVAGALKDNDRAVLIGTRTHGKGSVQSVIKLKDGSGALKLTTAYYYLPRGRNIDRALGGPTWGVDPTDGDYLAMDAPQLEAMLKRRQRRAIVSESAGESPRLTPDRIARDEDDPQLAAALRAMTGKLATGEFPEVGGPNPDSGDDASRRQLVEKRRAELLKDLERINKELQKLNGGAPQKLGVKPM